MKTRNGFVSNSSSSSFVIIGLNLTGKVKLADQEQYDEDRQELAGLTVFIGDSQVFVGEGESGGENEGAPEFSMGLDKINNLHDRMKAKLEPLGLWDENGFGVHSGQVPC